MSENLNKKPKKGILKQSSSFDKPGASNTVPGSVFPDSADMFGSITSNRKSTKFDEMNIIETLHPPDKDYGHMKIEEPKTPFNYYEDGEDGEIAAGGVASIDPVDLSQRLETSTAELQNSTPRGISSGSSSSAEDEDVDPEEMAKRQMFESKRKAHYNEYYAVKLARKLLEQEADEEDNNEGEGVGAVESVEVCENEASGGPFVPIEEVGNE